MRSVKRKPTPAFGWLGCCAGSLLRRPSSGAGRVNVPEENKPYLEGISNYLGTNTKVLYAVDIPPLDEVFENSEFTTTSNGASG
jgi:hypothetical protein